MEKFVAALGGVLLCVFATVVCEDPDVDRNQQAVARANNAFASELLKTYRNEPGNLVVSPFSVNAVLAMLLQGAEGETARELTAGLRLPDNRTVVQEGFRKFIESSKSTPTVTLNIANNIYIQQGFGVKQQYREVAKNKFYSDAVELDFSKQAEQARQTINQWVAEKTHDKIRDLIGPDTLDQSTLMVLVNAVYFQGGWRHPFEEDQTNSEPFYTTPDSPVNVSMMHQRGYLLYGDLPDLNAKALQLFYRGAEDDQWGRDATQSMILILPNEIDGLSRLENQLTSINVTEIKEHLRSQETNVALPKFTIEKTVPLEEKLKEVGITKIFQPGADLSGFTDANTYVNKVLQKARVEVTEKGTTAAASTFIQAVPTSLVWPTPEFVANHPFLFLIVDDTSDMILFMGRVEDPS